MNVKKTMWQYFIFLLLVGFLTKLLGTTWNEILTITFATRMTTLFVLRRLTMYAFSFVSEGRLGYYVSTIITYAAFAFLFHPELLTNKYYWMNLAFFIVFVRYLLVKSILFYYNALGGMPDGRKAKSIEDLLEALDMFKMDLMMMMTNRMLQTQQPDNEEDQE